MYTRSTESFATSLSLSIQFPVYISLVARREFLSGQLEKVISIEKQAVGQLRGTCTQSVPFSFDLIILFFLLSCDSSIIKSILFRFSG